MDSQPRIAVESADLRYVYRLLQQDLEESLNETMARDEYSDATRQEALAAAHDELRKTFEMARFAVNVLDVRVSNLDEFKMYCEANYGSEPLDLDLNQRVFDELTSIGNIADDVAYQRTDLAAKAADMFSESAKTRLAAFDALIKEDVALPAFELPLDRVDELGEDLAAAVAESQALRQEIPELIAKMRDIKRGMSA